MGVETQTREIEEARSAIADEVIEAEKQVMLWQRKIHLESEMQKALDPSVGNMETVAMKREIHRMELRLEQLKRRQEQIIVEMERAVHKRSALQLKYEPQAKKAAPKNARRELENLKRSLRTATDGRAQTEDQISKKEAHVQELQSQIGSAQEEASKLEQMTVDLKANISVTKVVTEINHAKINKVMMRRQGAENASAENVGVGVDAEQLQHEQEYRKKLANMVQYFRDRFADVEVFHPQLWSSFYENQ